MSFSDREILETVRGIGFEHPTPIQAAVIPIALSGREVNRVLKLWTQTVLAPILSSALFILVFGLSLGSRIHAIDGVSYDVYIVPGLIAMTMAQAAYGNNSASVEQLIAERSSWISNTLDGCWGGGAARRWASRVRARSSSAQTFTLDADASSATGSTGCAGGSARGSSSSGAVPVSVRTRSASAGMYALTGSPWR